MTKRHGGRPAAPRDAPPREAASAAPLGLARIAAGAALIALLVAAAYLQALRGPFLWDDHAYVVENDMVRSSSGIRDIWLEPSAYRMQWFPVTYTTLWLDFRLFGESTFGYHVSNLVQHALGALLAWALLRRLAVRGAFAASLLFAVHPVHVESVAWICERKNTLSLIFMLGALLAWLRHERTGRRLDLALLVALAALGLLSKSIVALLAPAMLVLAWWRFPGGVTRRTLVAAAPVAALSVAMLLVTASVEETHQRGAGRDLSAGDSAVLLGRALWFYSGKLVAPIGLTSIYPKWTVDPARAADWVAPAAWIAVLAAAFHGRTREGVGRGPFAALLLFTAAHAPTGGIADFGFFGHSWVADHFQHVPSLPFLALVVGVATAGVDRAMAPASRARASAAILAVAVAALVPLTRRHAATFASAEAFWGHSLAMNPTHAAAGALGDAYLRQGDLDRALALIRRSLELNENERGYFRLGELLEKRGDVAGAEAAFLETLEVSARRNRDPLIEARAHFNLGSLRWRRGDFAGAAFHYRAAARLQPREAQFAEWAGKAEARAGAGR